MTTTPYGLAVSDDVYTAGVVGGAGLRNRGVVHQLHANRTVCGLSTEEVPTRMAAGYAAVSPVSWCRRCFPTTGIRAHTDIEAG